MGSLATEKRKALRKRARERTPRAIARAAWRCLACGCADRKGCCSNWDCNLEVCAQCGKEDR